MGREAAKKSIVVMMVMMMEEQECYKLAIPPTPATKLTSTATTAPSIASACEGS